MGMGAMAAGTAVQAGSSLAGGISGAGAASAQGSYQAAMYSLNAGLEGMQSDQVLRQGSVAAGAAVGRTRQLVGAQRAAGASQGIDVNTGSAAVAQADAAGIGAMDALTIKNNAYLKAFGYQAQEIQSNASAAFAETGANASATASILTGGMGFVSSGLRGASFMSGGYSNQNTSIPTYSGNGFN